MRHFDPRIIWQNEWDAAALRCNISKFSQTEDMSGVLEKPDARRIAEAHDKVWGIGLYI